MSFIKFPVGNGWVSIFDAEDEAFINSLGKLFVDSAGYAVFEHKIGHFRTIVHVHKTLMNCNHGRVLDHKNGNKLDNRKENLRAVTYGQNCQNRANFKTTKSSSIYRGVFRTSNGKRWRAKISFENKSRAIGTFDSEIEAAQAYDFAARELFGPMARTNFVKEV